MLYFVEKTAKIGLQRWRLRPQTPELFLPLPIAVTFAQPFSLFSSHVITIEKEQQK